MLAKESILDLTMIGTPAIHPGDPEFVVYAKAKMDMDADRYDSRLVLYHRKTGHAESLMEDSDADASPQWSPSGQLLAFLRKGELWIYEWKTSVCYPLGVKVKDYCWSPSGDKLAFVQRVQTKDDVVYHVDRLRYKNDGEGLTVGYNHVFVVDVNSKQVVQASTATSDHQVPVFDQRGERLAFVREFYDDDRNKEPQIELVYVEALLAGSAERLVWDPGIAQVTTLFFTGEDRLIGVGKQQTEASVEVDKFFKLVIGEQAEWPAVDVAGTLGTHILSDSRRTGKNMLYRLWDKRLFFIATVGHQQRLFVLEDQSIVEIPIEGTVICFDVSRTDDLRYQVVAVVDQFDQPSELFVLKWDAERREIMEEYQCSQYQDRLVSKLAPIHIDHYRYLAHDGFEIEGWTMAEQDWSPSDKGSIVMIHGGPHFSYGNTFFFDFHYLVQQGYRLIFCNPRGSAGYGQEFQRAVIGNWGSKDVTDIVGFVDLVQAKSKTAGEKLVVMGGSYGGFLVNWLVSHDHRFTAAITERSISNFYSKYGNSDIGFRFNRVEFNNADLWGDEELLMERSPIRYAKHVQTPMLIIHGEQDLRCPVEQSEQWYSALKRLGKQVDYYRFPGASHAFATSGRPKQRLRRLEVIGKWLAERV